VVQVMSNRPTGILHIQTAIQRELWMHLLCHKSCSSCKDRRFGWTYRLHY
jgi:hypothetical protein